MTSVLPRSLRAAAAACVLLAAACTPSPRTGADTGPAPEPSPLRAWTAQSPAGEIARWMRRECGGLLTNKAACVERNLVSLIDQAGIARTMEVLDTLVSVDGEVHHNAHALAHGLGIAAYRTPETLAATFAACPPTQMSGCYHGVVQGYFLSLVRQGKLPGTPELDVLCEPHRASTFLFFQCAHGIGHGLMAVHDNHLPMSLEACDLVTDGFVRESCYGGAFMENIVRVTHPHHTAEGHAGTQDAHARHGAGQQAQAGQGDHGDHGVQHAHAGGMQHGEWKPLDRRDPLYPCTVVAAKYQVSCYTMQSSAILFFKGGDVAETGRACARAPEGMQALCFMSLGRDVTALAAQNHRRSVDLCARTAGQVDGRGELWCLVGVVQNLVNLAADPAEGLRFCRVVGTEAHKGECYRTVGETIALLVPAAEQRRQQCASAEPGFVAVCRRGAGVADPSPGTDE